MSVPSVLNPANLEEAQATAPKEVESIGVLAGDLGGQADWDLANVTASPDLWSRSSVYGD